MALSQWERDIHRHVAGGKGSAALVLGLRVGACCTTPADSSPWSRLRCRVLAWDFHGVQTPAGSRQHQLGLIGHQPWSLKAPKWWGWGCCLLGMELCWWVLVCGAVLGVAGTTMAPATPASSDHTVVASVVSSGMGTRTAAPVLAAATVPGGAHAHPRSEEPSMNFTLRLLDGDPSAVKKPLVLSPGSAIRLEARVDFSPGVSLKISVDQCHGTSSEQLGRSRRIFMVVNSQGCLHGQKLGTVSIQHRRGVSALQLTIPAPLLEDETEEEEVYVHCLLTAWGARGHSARSCFYSQATDSWQNAEDPSRNAMCHCCDTGCPPDDTLPRELPGFLGEGTLHWETVGPLLVQKEKVPWYEEPCRTVKRFLLAGLALLGSALVAATLVGGLLGLALAVWRLGGRRRGQRQRRRQCPFQAELQTVVGALGPRETKKRGEVGPPRRSLAQSSV
ncbi:uncharacterized protein LOC141750914 [Larus michahellis]|uniref:uncharacterized protein LOC141750914 n=1 Tax=Larus michahellis TaxID=119627 RepID=UPI003D9BC67C